MNKRGIVPIVIIVLIIAVIGVGYLAKESVLFSPREETTPSICNRLIVGDFNTDCTLNFLDLSIMQDSWGEGDRKTDLNRDGIVDGGDLSILMDKWDEVEGEGVCDEFSIPNTIGECTQILCSGEVETESSNEMISVFSINSEGKDYNFEVKGSGSYVTDFDQYTNELVIQDYGFNTEEIVRLDELGNDDNFAETKTIDMENAFHMNKYLIIFKEDSLGKRVADLERASQPMSASEITDHKLQVLKGHENLENSIIRGYPDVQFGKSFYKALNAKVIEIDKDKTVLTEIKKDSNVKEIIKMKRLETFLYDSVPLINADDVWAMPDAGGTNITGKGVRIAVIDTGIDYTHEALGGCTDNEFLNGQCSKVVGGWDVVNNDSLPEDDIGHGTHVASIAAGDGVLKGAAPGAELLSYKVMGLSGGDSSHVVEAIEMAMDPNGDDDFSDHVDIISISVGVGSYSSVQTFDEMSQAVDTATGIGILSVAAAGRSGSYVSISSPGLAESALTIGNTNKFDVLNYQSPGGPIFYNNSFIIKPDVSAPGVEICAAVSSDGIFNEDGFPCNPPLERHISLSGTSMATPHVSGVAALLKQTYPSLTPEEMKKIISQNTILIDESSLKVGHGRVDALNSVTNGFVLDIDENIFETQDNVILSFNSSHLFGGGNTGIRFTGISYETVHSSRRPPEYGVFEITSSPGDLCIENSENFNLIANFNVPHLGIYAVKLEYDTFENCEFSSNGVSHGLPLLIHDVQRINITYDKQTALGGYDSEISAFPFCYDYINNQPPVFDPAWTIALIGESRWTQDPGEIVTQQLILYEDYSELDRCQVRLIELGVDFEEETVNEIVLVSNIVDEIYFTDVDLDTDKLVKNIKLDIPAYESVGQVISTSLFDQYSVYDLCTDLDFNVYTNGYKHINDVRGYRIGTNIGEIMWSYSHINYYIAQGWAGEELDSVIIDKEILVYNPFRWPASELIIYVNVWDKIFGGAFISSPDFAFPETYIPSPLIRKVKIIAFNGLDYSDDIVLPGMYQIRYLPLVGFSELTSPMTAFFAPTMIKDARNYPDHLSVPKSIDRVERFKALTKSILINEEFEAAISYFEDSDSSDLGFSFWFSFYSTPNFGDISITLPDQSVVSGTGLHALFCTLYTTALSPNPFFGYGCQNGIYKLTYDYSDWFKNSEGMVGEDCVLVKGNGENLTIGEC